MKRLILFLVIAFFAGTASARVDLQKPEYCIEFFEEEREVESITENVLFGGAPIIFLDWIWSYSTITVHFYNEGPLVWSPDTVHLSRLAALGDWIETAIMYEDDYGFYAFAARYPDGSIWLVSQFTDFHGHGCFAHHLDELASD